MKALVLEEQARLSYKDVDEPTPVGKRSVLLRIGAVGVCGSDILRYAKGKAYHYPLVLGHEFSGIVDKPPAESALRPGDRVAVFPLLPDHQDPFAKIGEYAVSSGYDYYGSRRDGAFGERLHVPEENLVSLPADMPLIYGACVEPAAVALHAMHKFDLPSNATGLVIGAGPIGAFAAQWLRVLGCSRVLVAEVDPEKQRIMAELGFEIIDARREDTSDAVRERTDGYGADCTVEASGLPSTLLQAIDAAATFGQVMLLGDVSGDVMLETARVSSILRRELRIYGTWNSKITPPGRSEWDMVISHMYRGDLAVTPLISHVPTLEEGPQVFSDMASRAMWYSKVVFAVSAEAQQEARNLKGAAS